MEGRKVGRRSIVGSSKVFYGIITAASKVGTVTPNLVNCQLPRSYIVTSPEVWLVGESFNTPQLLGRYSGRWSTDLAIRLGAFKTGRSRQFLLDLGFRWSWAVNLCPPCEWNDEVGRIIASEIFSEDVFFILAGSRVARSFGVSKQWFAINERYVCIPSVGSPAWKDPATRRKARDIAHHIYFSRGLL